MIHKQKSYASPILHKFTLLNLIHEIYFHVFTITSRNKSTSIVLFFLEWTIRYKQKSNPSPIFC